MTPKSGSSRGESECRHQLFDTARRRAECTITDLWVRYLALGGRLDLFTIEAYLSGLVPLPPDQQDVLANALNEALDDLCEAAKVPYLHTIIRAREPFYEDPVKVLDELLERHPPTTDPGNRDE